MRWERHLVSSNLMPSPYSNPMPANSSNFSSTSMPSSNPTNSSSRLTYMEEVPNNISEAVNLLEHEF